MSEFRLSLGERQTPLWVRLSEHLESELALLRLQNDNDQDAVKTAYLRGEIARIKTLLALADEPSEQPQITLEPSA